MLVQRITRSEIERERHRWINYIWNNEEIFREKPQYGNRDARFRPIGSEVGIIHTDQYNAISQPISHLAHWLHEKTGINEYWLRLVGYGVTAGTSAYVGYRLGKYAYKKLA